MYLSYFCKAEGRLEPETLYVILYKKKYRSKFLFILLIYSDKLLCNKNLNNRERC